MEDTRNFGKRATFSFTPGDSFGERYEIIDEIGRGGMGVVYKARDKELNTIVALKMIRMEFLSDKRMIERFKKEILLAREISHENVVRIYDFGEEQEVKFISMQYIEGKSLREIISGSPPLPFETIKDITQQICKGLLAAHKKGIVHRDLKPHNIMIDKNHNAYITDFGLAISTEASASSQSGSVIGTPQYIAPEQWMGDKVDNRADIYTLGIIIYEMITGTRPFTSETDIGYFQKHLNEKPTFPDSSGVKIPSYFKNIVKKCLEKKRQYRYHSAAGILADIEAGTFSRGSLFYRFLKSRGLKIATFAILMLIIMFLIFRLEVKKQANLTEIESARKFSTAVLPFQDLGPAEDDLDYCGYAFSFLLITDLEQSIYFKVLPENTVNEILKEKNVAPGSLYSEEIKDYVAERGNVDFVITGSCAKFGEKVRITVKIWDAVNHEQIGSDTEDAEMENVLDTIDLLTLKIKKRLHLSDAELFTDLDKALNTISTSSPKALKLYLKGKTKFNSEDYQGSIELYEKAIETDPEFAMAYHALSWAYAFLDDTENRMKYIKEANQHGEHLSQREKLFIEASYYSENEETYDQAVASFEALLRIYPDHVEALTRLGGLLTVHWEYDKALEYLRKAADENRLDHQPHAKLAYAYMAKGEYEKALGVIENFLKYSPGNVRMHELLYDIYVIREKFDLAELTLEKIFELSANMPEYKYKYNKGELSFYRGDLQQAEEDYSKYLHREEDEKVYLNSLKAMHQVLLLQGKFTQAAALIEKEINLTQDYEEKLLPLFELIQLYLDCRKPHQAEAIMKRQLDPAKTLRGYLNRRQQFYQALIYLQLNQYRQAEASMEELKKSALGSTYKKDIVYYDFLVGRYERTKKNYNLAVTHLKKAVDSLPHQMRGLLFRNQQALFLYELAITYYQAGNLQEARLYFEKITRLTLGRQYFGNLYARSFYYLGKIFLQVGWEGKALEHFEIFSKLWKNADPGLPEKKESDRHLKSIKKEKK